MYISVVQDKQCNCAAAAITDVFSSNGMAENFPNLNNKDRFKILKKIVVPMNSQAGVTTAFNNVMLPVDWYKKVDIPMD